MSESGRKDFAYPRSEEKAANFMILRFCGGAGGGGCAIQLGVTQFVYSIKVPKFIVYNRSMVFENPEQVGIDIYTDAGATMFCDHSAGSRVNWWIGFSDNGILTDAQVKAQNMMIDVTTDPPPQTIEVQGIKLPQPVLKGGGANPNWENRIYVHIVWDSPSYVTEAGVSEASLRLTKHDYDIKI